MKHSLQIALASVLVTAGISSPALATVAYLGLTDGVWQVWTIEDNGANPRQITQTPYDKVRASWFPDGQSLLVNGIDGYAYRVSLGGKETRIETELRGFQDAVVSPNGQRFAFSLSTSGSIDDNNIWTVGIDGNDPRKLTAMARLQHEPTFDPSGESIYFLSGDGGQVHDIWRISSTGGTPSQLTAQQVYHFDVAVAADGRIAFSNNRTGDYDLWVRSPDGAERQLTADAPLDARPSWSPDGRTIAFESSRGGMMAIWTINLETADIQQLTPAGSPARYPVWFINEGQ